MQPLINGVNYAWADIKLILFGIPVVGITSIEYNRKQKKENNYGQGNEPVSRGYGEFEYEDIKLEIYKDEWQGIINAAPSKDPTLIPPFEIQILFINDRLSTAPTVHLLKNCEFLEDGLTAKQGETKLLKTVTLKWAGLINK